MARRASDPARLFIVGDPKQSIYRFRRADVGVYRAHQRTAVSAAARGRSRCRRRIARVPEIQRFVNAAFREEMTGDERLAAGGVCASCAPSRDEHAAQPAIVALPVPRPYGWRQVTLEALQESQPGAIARVRVAGSCRRRARGRSRRADPAEAAGRRRHRAERRLPAVPPVPALRRATSRATTSQRSKRAACRICWSAARPFTSARKWTPCERRSPRSSGRKTSCRSSPRCTGRCSRSATRNCSSTAASRASFIPIACRRSCPSGCEPIADALTTLRELHAARNHRPVARHHRPADRSHARARGLHAVARAASRCSPTCSTSRIWRGSTRPRAGCRSAASSRRCAMRPERAQAPEAPILEEGSEGVRLMTVHKAKGLEFPIVVLADIGCRLSQRDGVARTSTSDRGSLRDAAGGLGAARSGRRTTIAKLRRDEAEGVRLAYVAATRARDLLVVPAVGDGPFENGLGPPAQRRALSARRERARSRRPRARVRRSAARTPCSNGPTVRQPDASTVRPGAYTMSDPATRRLVTRWCGGIRCCWTRRPTTTAGCGATI